MQQTREPTTGAIVLIGDDGLVRLKDEAGQIHKVHPQDVAGALTTPNAPLHVATPEDFTAHQDAQTYRKATAQQKIEWGRDELIKSTADGVTAVPRLVAGVGYGVAKKLGYGTGVSPLEESLSGEALLRKLDEVAGSPEEAAAAAEHRRAMTEGAPWLAKTATDVGGFLAGGRALSSIGALGEAGGEALGLSGKAARAIGSGAEALSTEGAGHAVGRGVTALTGSARAGKYAGSAVEGAAIGATAAADEAWIKDEKLTAEAYWSSIGMGGVLGGATSAGLDLIGAIPRTAGGLAEKVFGKKPAIGSILDKASDTASDDVINEAAKDITGSAPSKTFAGKFRDWIRGHVEAAQSAATGVPRETLEEVGALRSSPRALKAQALVDQRPELLQAGTTDLAAALTELQAKTEPILREDVDLALKRENIKPLFTGDREAMMKVGQGNIDSMERSLQTLDATTGRGRSLYGKGAQVADLRGAYEDAIDALKIAAEPEDVAMALDSFKRQMQHVKARAALTARQIPSDIGKAQAAARSKLAFEASENTRALLEQEDLWGKFGAAQKEKNSAWNRLLDTDAYVRPNIAEQTGRVSQGERFGEPKWEVSERKVAAYLDGLGTPKSSLLDGKLRDNIVTRKELAAALVKHYDLGEHAANLHDAIGASDRALKILGRMDESVADLNKLQMIQEAEAHLGGSGLGSVVIGSALGGALAGPIGATVGGVLGQVVTRPMTMVRQKMALAGMVSRARGTIAKHIDATISGGAEGRAAMRGAAGTPGLAKIREVAAEAEERVGIKKYATEIGKEQAKSALDAEMKSRNREVKRGISAAAARSGATAGDHRYQATAGRVTALSQDPIAAAQAIAEQVGHIEHPKTQQAMILAGMNALQFLQTKVPAPILGDSPLSPKQLSSVSAGQKAKFMRYYDAVNAPLDVFHHVERGTATPEEMEALKVCYPELYGQAQIAVMKAVHLRKSKAPLPLQTRLKVAELFDDAGAIEPTLNGAFMARVSQAAAQGNATENAKGKSIGPNLAASMKSNLDTLRL